MAKYPRIIVKATRSNKFRAKISEGPGTVPYEVTVGGLAWQNGKGKLHEDIILQKCSTIINALTLEYNNLTVPEAGPSWKVRVASFFN